MMLEIERKFLVCGEQWRQSIHEQRRLVQAYLVCTPRVTVRVRIDEGRREARLGVKVSHSALSRLEVEPCISLEDAQALSAQGEGISVEKTRYAVRQGGFVWEIDVFEGANTGLIVAEIELPAEDTAFDKPGWVGEEITHDARYSNAALAGRPYSQWR